MKISKQVIKYVILGITFGTIYYHIEVLAVGHSSIYMFFVGAIAALCCGLINEVLDWETAFLSQMVISAVVITIIEFISGIILNKLLEVILFNRKKLLSFLEFISSKIGSFIFIKSVSKIFLL